MLAKAKTARQKIRNNSATLLPWKIFVFTAGFVCVGIGIALSVLPGPLTIPPVLLGLWIWSSEFEWAHKLFESFKYKALEAWKKAKEKPFLSAIFTVLGLAVAAAVFWAINYYELLDKAKQMIVG